MKNLSELSDDILLTVAHRNDGDFEVMSKEEFLNSSYFLDMDKDYTPEVTIADAEVKKMNDQVLCEMINTYGYDDTYEDWEEDIVNYLNVCGYKEKIIEMLKEAFDHYPIYWEGEKVNIDVWIE